MEVAEGGLSSGPAGSVAQVLEMLERQRLGWQTVGGSASSLVPGMLVAGGTEIRQHIGWGSLHLLTTPLHTPHTAGSAFQVKQQNPF